MDLDVKQVAQELAPVVSENVKSEVAEATKSLGEDIKNLQTEMVSFKEAIARYDEKTDANQSKLAKTAIVNLFKAVKKNGVENEAQFKEVFDTVVKETYQNTLTATDGAEFVFEQFERDVYAIFEQYPLLNELNTIKLLKGRTIDLPKYDGGVEAHFVGEGSAFTPSKVNTGNLKIDIYKLGALVSLTDEMLEDDMTTETLYNLILTEAGTKFANKLESEILVGDGTHFQGIITANDVNAFDSGATSVENITDKMIFDADALIDEKYDVNPGNKVAIMKKATRNTLYTLRDINGNLVFPELRETNMIGDYRIVTARSMPTIATGACAILLGNVRNFYYHISRKGFTAELGHLENDFGLGKKTLRCERRDGGAPKDAKAFVRINMGTVA